MMFDILRHPKDYFRNADNLAQAGFLRWSFGLDEIRRNFELIMCCTSLGSQAPLVGLGQYPWMLMAELLED